MSTTGDLPDVSGLSDTQLIISYYTRLGSGSLVASLGTNLPSGKTELTSDEFLSAILISQRAYNFRVPSLGQGFGASPSLTWAMPMGDNMSIGVGASYQFRGAYKPFEFRDEEYTPGDEVLVTGGVNFRLDPQSGISLDVSHSIYAADQFDGVEIYQSGGKTSVTASYRRVIEFDELRITAHYRSLAKNSTLVDGTLVAEALRTIPNQLTGLVSYRKRFSQTLTVTALLEGRSFNETELFDKRTMVGIGVLPSLNISPQAALTGRLIYTAGTISGIEAGLGIAFGL